MRIIPTFGTIGLLFLIASPVFGGQTYNPLTGKYDLCSTVQETDGSPANVACLPVNVPNGTVADNTSSITLNYAGLPSGGLFTTGSIPFGNGTASLAQNNANFFWDNTNTRLGIGTASPSQRFVVSDGTTERFIVNTAGDITLQPGGNSANSVLLNDDLGTNILKANRNNGLLLASSLQFLPSNTNHIGQAVGTNVPKNVWIGNTLTVGSQDASALAAGSAVFSGNVGIGTTGPQVPLQVNGRIAVNGNPVDVGPIIDVVGTYTPTSGNGIGIQIRPTLNPGANGSGYLFAGGGTINKAGSGTHAMFATYAGNPPTVGANAGSTLTNAAILYMTGTTAGATNNYALYSDSASNSYFAGNVGIGTTNPTHALTLPSTSSGLVLYSTADQTTNYGRLRLFNNGGIMTFVTDIAGTVGSGDINLRFQVGDGSNVRFLPNQFTFNPSAAGTAFTFGTGTIDGPLSLRPDVRTLAGTDANSPLTIGGFSQWAPTSGTAKYILEQTYFNPSSGAAKLIGHALEVPINQTGTATGDFTALHVNVTETAVTGTNKLLMDLQVGGTSQVRITDKARMYRSGGTAIATTDWALTSGWGANATISAVTGNDSRGTVTVTTSALDTPSANPVLTLTFKDLTWSSVPFCMVCMDHGSTGPSTVPATCQATATTLVVSYRGTPTATSALTYKVNFMVLG